MKRYPNIRCAAGPARAVFSFVVAVAIIAGHALMPAQAFAEDPAEGAAEKSVEGYEKVADLNGLPIGVQTAVLYEEMIKDRCPDSPISYYTMPNDMILALKSGKVSGYLIEGVSFYVQESNHSELMCLQEPAGTSSYACVVGNNEKQDLLLKQLNEFIANMNRTGQTDEMYDYWIMNFDPDKSRIEDRSVNAVNGQLDIAIEGGYEPFSFISNGEVSGFDVDFMLRFCRTYGYEPVFYEVPFESISPGAETGKYDIGLNIVISEERSEGAALSDAYYSCPIYMVVLGDEEGEAGFFEGIALSFSKTFIKEGRWKLFLAGTGRTILITACSIAFGTVLGFAVYMLCRHGNPAVNGITNFFIWLIHGMPTVVLLMILYYIVFGNIKLSGTWVSVVGFTLIFACAMFDMLRVGSGAIGKGQTEASRALGYSDRQSFFKIILPQAALHFLPIYRNEVVTLIKESSVVGYITVLDLTKISDFVRSRTYDAFFPLIATAAVYFAIAWMMTSIVRRVELNINPRRRSKEKILAGIKEQA